MWRCLDEEPGFRWELLELGLEALDACRIKGDAFITRPTTTTAPLPSGWRRRGELARRQRDEPRSTGRHSSKGASVRAWLDEQRTARARDYEERLRTDLAQEFPKVLDLLEVELRTDMGICVHPAVWHATLWRKLIEGRIGFQFEVASACAPFMTKGNHRDTIFKAVRGCLDFYASGYWVEGPVTVAADAKRLPEAEVGSWEVRL